MPSQSSSSPSYLLLHYPSFSSISVRFCNFSILPSFYFFLFLSSVIPSFLHHVFFFHASIGLFLRSYLIFQLPFLSIPYLAPFLHSLRFVLSMPSSPTALANAHYVPLPPPNRCIQSARLRCDIMMARLVEGFRAQFRFVLRFATISGAFHCFIIHPFAFLSFVWRCLRCVWEFLSFSHSAFS